MLRTCDWSQEMGWWAEGAGPEGLSPQLWDEVSSPG